MGLVNFVRKSNLKTIKKPVLIIYSPKDKIVNAQAAEKIYTRIGSKTKKIIPITESENPEYHVLAGDILASGNTEQIANIILEYISQLQ